MVHAVQAKRILLTSIAACALLVSGCDTFDEQQYIDGTMNEVNKTHTGWMDHHWEDSGNSDIGRFENVDPEVGPDRRPF